MTPCQRCIGGQMLAGACLQCGYRPPRPDPLPYVPRVGSELARRQASEFIDSLKVGSQG